MTTPISQDPGGSVLGFHYPLPVNCKTECYLPVPIGTSTNIQLTQNPFCHCVIPNIIKDQDFVDRLQEEILDLTFSEKNNDLYKFHQSLEDLKVIESPLISRLRSFIYKDLLKWIQEVTGIELNNNVDMSCASYRYTDILLCHDDELDDRRVAFIYYLVPKSWREEDGGSLDLFCVDSKGEPREIVKSIHPKRNTFVFFEVGPTSFHQVSEILTEDKTRLSVSGWFHGPPVYRPPAYVEIPPSPQPYLSIEEEEFYSWINPLYLDPETQAEIKDTFKEESQIELHCFLQEDKYEALMTVLKSKSDSQWKKQGPAHKRHYWSLDNESPDIVQSCVRFLQSDAMFLVLSSLTGLRLHELAQVSDDDDSDDECDNKKDTKGQAMCRSVVRRWTHGCYTLVHDSDIESGSWALDAVLFIDCDDWKPEYGGVTSYIAKGEKEELLSVCPKANGLALVYRDTETCKFVKHLNKLITELPNKCFYDISSVYYE
ncbi:hypothetical protein FSP39_021333 [Pinctada imbricata]|uniref:uS12 prolyl 3-hydroxylase n=1 Tax=Pinctada imbricata TaxID=66713 RepID=A0AA88XSM6_PINIB|nr:hypothetical protein FSP39_021333 [Pinctada imbricata]